MAAVTYLLQVLWQKIAIVENIFLLYCLRKLYFLRPLYDLFDSGKSAQKLKENVTMCDQHVLIEVSMLQKP